MTTNHCPACGQSMRRHSFVRCRRAERDRREEERDPPERPGLLTEEEREREWRDSPEGA